MKNIIKVYRPTYVEIHRKKVVDVIEQLQKIVEETNDDVIGVCDEYEIEIDFVFEREETDKEYAERLAREANLAEDIKQRELRQLRALKEKYGDIE